MHRTGGQQLRNMKSMSSASMVQTIRLWYLARADQPYVRPWGLATPILVLVVCLPLLRPLRHPVDVSDNEAARLATIESIVERHTLSIDSATFQPVHEQVIRMEPTEHGLAPRHF